jgi:hypothetical protein
VVVLICNGDGTVDDAYGLMTDLSDEDVLEGSVHFHARCRVFIGKCCTVKSIHSMYVTVHERSKWKKILYNAACLRL